MPTTGNLKQMQSTQENVAKEKLHKMEVNGKEKLCSSEGYLK